MNFGGVGKGVVNCSGVLCSEREKSRGAEGRFIRKRIGTPKDYETWREMKAAFQKQAASEVTCLVSMCWEVGGGGGEGGDCRVGSGKCGRLDRFKGGGCV